MPRGRPDLFLPLAEGESGLDIPLTIGTMSVGGSNTETIIAGTSLQAGEIYFNYTTTPNMQANPAAYAGTFMTDFTGQILAGRRLDGLEPVLPATPWNTASPYNIPGGSLVRTQTNTDIKVFSGTAVGVDNIYSPQGGIGLDIFFTPATYSPMTLSVLLSNVAFTDGSVGNILLINAGFPFIWNNPQIDAPPGYIHVFNAIYPIKTRPRPEGYNPGETGLQIFWTQLGAVNPQPPPFPALPGGFIYNTYAPGSANVPTFRWSVS